MIYNSFRSYLYEMTARDAIADIKKLKIPKDISKLSRSQAQQKCPEVLKFYDELIDTIRKSSYTKSIDFIDDIIKEPKLKFLLSLGFGGNFASLNLNINQAVLPVQTLVPTQSEIGLGESLDFIIGAAKNFKPANIDVCFDDEKTGVIIKRPIVTFNHNFIVDGHHRWSQIYITNPNANVKVINITGQLTVIALLKAIQSTIGSNTGNLNLKKVQGKNIFKISDNSINKYIKNNITETALEHLDKYYTEPVEDLYQNVLQLKYNTPHVSSFDREYMPQTSKDTDLFKDLDNGIETL